MPLEILCLCRTCGNYMPVDVTNIRLMCRACLEKLIFNQQSKAV